MSCTETIKYLYEFMDEELDKPQYFRVKKHLGHCDECHRRYKFQESIRSLVKTSCANIPAPVSLYKKITEGLNSLDKELTAKEPVYRQKTSRIVFSSRLYTIAASILLSMAGGIFYYTNYHSYDSLFDDAVKNHVVAVNDNLIFNEKTSVVGNVNKYLGNTLNTGNIGFNNTPPFLSSEQIRVVGGMPVMLCGTNSACVIFDKGGNKLSLQTIRNNRFPVRNLEKAQLGPKEFYVGNHQGFNSVLWEENGVTYCLTSNINKNEMLNLAKVLTSR